MAAHHRYSDDPIRDAQIRMDALVGEIRAVAMQIRGTLREMDLRLERQSEAARERVEWAAIVREFSDESPFPQVPDMFDEPQVRDEHGVPGEELSRYEGNRLQAERNTTREMAQGWASAWRERWGLPARDLVAGGTAPLELNRTWHTGRDRSQVPQGVPHAPRPDRSY